MIENTNPVEALRQFLTEEGSMTKSQIEEYISQQSEIWINEDGDIKCRQYMHNDVFQDILDSNTEAQQRKTNRRKKAVRGTKDTENTKQKLDKLKRKRKLQKVSRRKNRKT
tara:strand:+ start:204 stop:536 length:333 start_codon:yes stop_codon:yes gene_type:complete